LTDVQDSRAMVRAELDALIARVREREATHAADIAAVPDAMLASARNLVHYLAVRQVDVRPLQRRLRALGLSSLGRLEGCVLHTLLTVRGALAGAAGAATEVADHEAAVAHGDTAVAHRDAPGFDDGATLLAARAAALFGPPPRGRDTRIMVTMPSEAATDAGMVAALVDAGMDVMRINAAHDDAAAWRTMVANLRATEAVAGRRLCVALDVAGPKLRTGPPAHVLGVARLRVRRGPRGELVEPCRVELPDTTRLPLPEALLAALRDGDRLDVRDARDRWRTGVVTLQAGRPTAVFDRSVYVESGAAVRVRRGDAVVARDRLGALPDVEVPLRVQRGDRIRVLRREQVGNATGACVGCTLPAALANVAVGHAIWFDDGRIGGSVTGVDADGIDVEVRHVRDRGASLRAGKGINLPDTEIRLPALTVADVAVLEQLAGSVDAIGMSFVRTPDDVAALHAALDRAGAGRTGVILKIENRQAFEQLPRILLAAMRRGPFAVMLARGDLAVEVGFERLAEVQEEMLWLCEAAHAPVIWATQVLEALATTGMPSRAEVTDAAMAERAECVMLNKGPYVADAVRFLDGVLRRMQEHQYKKRAMLRRLRVSEFD
jgi:pyruvate kinase